ncbi:hypothetical protein C8J56DRAFT_1027526 [Mycena floridula]|nr:hypothetical protein C8J56DRAFT_1027526 [Mycena floridula]
MIVRPWARPDKLSWQFNCGPKVQINHGCAGIKSNRLSFKVNLRKACQGSEVDFGKRLTEVSMDSSSFKPKPSGRYFQFSARSQVTVPAELNEIVQYGNPNGTT